MDTDHSEAISQRAETFAFVLAAMGALGLLYLFLQRQPYSL